MKALRALVLLAAFGLLSGCIRKKAAEPAPQLAGPLAVTPEEDFRRKPPAVEDRRILDLPPVTQVVLENGLVLVLVPRADLPFATLVYANRAAHDDGSAARHGLPSLTLQALAIATRGDGNQPIRNPNLDGEAINTLATHAGSALALTAVSERVPAAAQLLAVVLQRPAFDSDSLARARYILGSHANQRATQISDRLRAAVLTGLYGPDPVLALPLSGVPMTLGRLGEADVKRFYADRYGPRGSVLVAVGAFDREQFVAAARAAFADWKGPEGLENVPAFPPPVPSQRASGVFVVAGGLAQARVAIGLPCVGTRNSEDLVFDLISKLLANGLRSRSMLALRHHAGSSYGVYGECLERTNSGEFMLTFDANPASVRQAIDTVLLEMKQLGEAPVPEAELQAAKQAYLGSIATGLQTNAGLATALASLYMYERPGDYYAGLEARVRGLSAADVQRIAATYFRRERARIAVMGDGEQLKSQLSSFGPITWF